MSKKIIALPLLSLICLSYSYAAVDVGLKNLPVSELPEGIIHGPGRFGLNRSTDFCGVVRDQTSTSSINDALRGMELSVVLQYGEGFGYFVYDPEKELSENNPRGMIANILDELAERSGFFWRDSFAVYDNSVPDTLFGSGAGKWDKMLNWTTRNFDLSVDKWIVTTKRLENHTVFLNSWFDATLIIVDEGNEAGFNWLGWSRPFDKTVWCTIVATIILSAIFNQVLEFFGDKHRKYKSYGSWFGENLYLSSMACSQNFVYNEHPSDGASRIFMFSFAFWGMLIGAAYTANLATMLVTNALHSGVDSLQSAIDQELSICIHDGSASHSIVESLYPKAISYSKMFHCKHPAEMYYNLENKVCDVLVGTRQEFDTFKLQKQFGCGLVQAGRDIHSSMASFAIQFDPLNCDSVLAFVLNLHLHGMKIDGNFTKIWENYIATFDGSCEDDNGGTSIVEKETILNIRGMFGVFLLHGSLALLALCVGAFEYFRKKSSKAIEGKSPKSKYVNLDFQHQYEDLKNDFISQLDNLFEVRALNMHAETSSAIKNMYLGMEDELNTSSRDGDTRSES